MLGFETVILDSGLYSDAFKRTQNMDAALVLNLQEQPGATGGVWLGVVCDGTSDSLGKQASRLAMRSICQDASGLLELLPRLHDRLEGLEKDCANLSAELFLRETEGTICRTLFPLLREMILNAHHQILNSKVDSATTITLAVIYHGYVLSANLGDSPAFLINRREESHECLPLYELHNRGGGLTRWIGSRSNITNTDIPVFCHALDQDSLVILGSDGALPARPEEELIAALLPRKQFNEQCAYLLSRAQTIGSTDNFTYISARTGLQPD